MLHNILVKFIFCTLSFCTLSASAIQISSMFYVADSLGQGVFTVNNITDKRLFLNVGMNEVKVEGGKLVKVYYTRENVNDWELSVRPGKTLIEPGFEKDFRVSITCLPECRANDDMLFQLAFVPTPYVEKELVSQQKVQMAIGFAPLFVLPAEIPVLDYEVKYKKNKLYLKNKGNTYLQLTIDGCVKEAGNKDCQQQIKLLAGREMEVTLNDNVSKSPIKIIAKTYKSKLKDERFLDRE